MNKFIKSLLVAALAVSASHLQATTTVTDKTTLVPRSHGVNLALENTAGWYDLIHRKSDDKFGGNFQAAFFYADSTNKKELGQYFGVANKNVFTFGQDAVTSVVQNQDLDFGYFAHTFNAGAAATAGGDQIAKITLNPEQKAIGAYLNYHQDFCKILNGLYLRVNLPVVNVENSMHFTAEGKDAATTKTVQDFLAGNLDNSAVANNAQAKLTNALIDGSKNSKTGVADIDVILGYDFLQSDVYHASINLGVTIPTGTQPDGKKVFAPTIGNGQHVGFGGGVDFGAQVMGDDEGGLRVHGQLNYRYLFQSKEKRTIGIKGLTNTIGGWEQYALLGTVDATGAAFNVPLLPAANVLTQDVNVTPGSQLDAIVSLGYNIWGLAFDLGYNVYYRESESVSLKNKFADGTYAVAAKAFDTAGSFNGPAANAGPLSHALTAADLDVNAAASPSQTTHKIYGGLAYYAKDWETPVLFGAGAHYEFAGQQGIEGWGVNVKAGLSF